MSGSAKSVLVVDDDADVRLSLKLALELAGYTVSLAADGREALQRQREEAADILITDIFMPGADGFETITSFRSEFPSTKIVVISGAGKLARREYLSTVEMIGVDATLKKPFEVDALLETLSSLS